MTDQPGTLRRAAARARAVVGIALVQMRYAPARTALSVLGVVLAVLAVTLLASTGLGVIDTGQEQLASADRDLWLSGGPVELTPTGGLENPVVDAHRIAADLEAREEVQTAAPLAFHTISVHAAGDSEVVTAVGVPDTHTGMDLDAGEGFSRGDVHYGDGGYNGPRTDEVILDRSTADALNVTVGETVTVGSNRGGEGRDVTVVGISSTYSQFLGTATLTMPLSELQQLAGTTGADRATFVTVTLSDDTNAEAARADINDAYPEYEVRTNREQFETMLESQMLVLAAATAVVVLAVLLGSALMLNVLAISVVQESAAAVALTLLGVSRRTFVGVVVIRGLVTGLVGGMIGLAATPALALALDTLVYRVTGFPDLVRPTTAVYGLGAAVAIVTAAGGSVAVGWLLASRIQTRIQHADFE